ncbi:hypothetical protein LTR78_003697 [Recurvomyces mirabilis]|uniref:Uncharacterized protein n=1 Tax=Recurvomyces mirabilis TaxID=574656 RepID=A0AAE1C365_9PEZI|nr:hypothetical protein LTR78_003697 [Recurvomyces mirabilis]KAK5154809.1 hypothetical protein LTS14_006390 [Recurvomyces mirabilis]
MADQATASPLPPTAGSNGKSQPAPTEISREMQQKRVNHRNRRQRPPQAIPQQDGTVSDSVTGAAVSPRTKKPQKVREPTPSSAPQHNGQMGKATVAAVKPRPVSMGGPMLPATPAKEQAYAGPTFHNSPAPSTLPMPKFFSRSVPGKGNPLAARMEGEKTPEKTDSSPEPEVVSPIPPRNAIQSPLDMFFQADKQEREHRASSGGMLSPEMATRRPVPATEPRNAMLHNQKSIFLHELDGNNESIPSPKTVPKNKKPAPISRAHSSPGMQLPAQEGEQRHVYTQSLKDILFNTAAHGSPAQNRTPPQQQQLPTPPSNTQHFNRPSPFNRPASGSGPSTPAPPADPANNYALHYGNRNLSPLFQAARTGNDTPSRPSELRQELPGQDGTYSSPPQNPPPPPLRHLPLNDPNDFMRGFLNQQAQAAVPSEFPQFPYDNGHGGGGGRPPSAHQQQYQGDTRPFSAGSAYGNGNGQQPQHAPNGMYNGSSGNNNTLQGRPPPPHTNGAPHSPKTMQENLMRMLNLNVSG